MPDQSSPDLAEAEQHARTLAAMPPPIGLPFAVLLAEYDRRAAALAERGETIERLCVDLDRLEHAAREWRYAEDEIRVRRQEYAALEKKLVAARSERDLTVGVLQRQLAFLRAKLWEIVGRPDGGLDTELVDAVGDLRWPSAQVSELREQRAAVLVELESSAAAGLQHVSVEAIRRTLGVTE